MLKELSHNSEVQRYILEIGKSLESVYTKVEYLHMTRHAGDTMATLV